MPNLAGLSLADAKSVLQSSQLSLGAVVYEGEINDTMNTKVKRQNPEFVSDATIRSGESVDLFLSAE
jgi:beta-lactam-binding protein with PASTA domain